MEAALANIDMTKLRTAAEREAEALEAERRGMAVFRLAFFDACMGTSFGNGTVMDAIDFLLSQVSSQQSRRFDAITQFERWRPEIDAYLIAGIGMTPDQIDDLFRLAMEIERS